MSTGRAMAYECCDECEARSGDTGQAQTVTVGGGLPASTLLCGANLLSAINSCLTALLPDPQGFLPDTSSRALDK